MSAELITVLAQFGPAGLIGLLWIVERRSASVRDRQLAEAHATLAQQHNVIDAVVGVIKENTRAIVTLEQTQRQLIALARSLLGAAAKSTAHAPSGAVGQ